MKHPGTNHYARAFQSWLDENKVKYIAVDQSKRVAFAANRIKSFDFLLYPNSETAVLTELKGRKFKGDSLAGLKNLQNWVTADDVKGLMSWEKIFDGTIANAVFVFTYMLEKIDVDSDGEEIYDFADNRYVFLAIELDDYRKNMMVRSPRWKTVYIPAKKFKNTAKSLRQFLFKEHCIGIR